MFRQANEQHQESISIRPHMGHTHTHPNTHTHTTHTHTHTCISHMFHIQTSECATQGGHQRRTSFSAPYHRSKVGIFCPLVGLFFPLVGLFYILGISTRPASARPITGFKRDLFTKETYVDAKEPQVSFILFCFFYKRDLRRRKRATASDRAGWLVTALFC